MYPATVTEATALYESSLAECCAHPNDPSVLTSQFDKLVDFLVHNFPMPLTPDFGTKCSDLDKISFEDFKEGGVPIEMEWTPTFLVQKLLKTFYKVCNTHIPVGKSSNWKKFVDHHTLSQTEYRFRLPRSGDFELWFASGDLILAADACEDGQLSVTCVFVVAAERATTNQLSLKHLDPSALPRGWHLLCHNLLITKKNFHPTVKLCLERADTLGLLNTKD